MKVLFLLISIIFFLTTGSPTKGMRFRKKCVPVTKCTLLCQMVKNICYARAVMVYEMLSCSTCQKRCDRCCLKHGFKKYRTKSVKLNKLVNQHSKIIDLFITTAGNDGKSRRYDGF